MKNLNQATKAYIEDHLSKTLEQSERRLNALAAIEKVFSQRFLELLLDQEVFTSINKIYLIKQYECLKGTAVSSVEKSVFNGLYKFSI